MGNESSRRYFIGIDMSSDKNGKEKQPPKRACRAISKLHTLVEYLEFYMGKDNKTFRNHVIKELAQDIEEVLHELSIEKNIDHVRLATKLKTIWKKQLDEKIEERVEEEVEQRLENILGDIKNEDN